jgi:hypothetical protein
MIIIRSRLQPAFGKLRLWIPTRGSFRNGDCTTRDGLLTVYSPRNVGKCPVMSGNAYCRVGDRQISICESRGIRRAFCLELRASPVRPEKRRR